MKRRLPSIALLFALASSAAAQDGGNVRWIAKGETNVVPTYLAARKEGRPFFLFFTAEGNPDCVALSSGAFSDPAVVEASSKFTCIYVECGNGKNAGSVKDFKITKYPTISILDPEGNYLGEVRERDADTIARALRQVAEKVVLLPAFPEDIDGALAAARRASMPLLVYFYDDSPGCLVANKSIQDAELKPLRDRFFFARWKFKRGSDVCVRFDVDRAPSILVLDPRLTRPEEKPLTRISTSRSPRELRRDLDEALAGWKSGADAAPTGGSIPLPDPKEKLSDDEVDRKFIRARISIATDLQREGKKAKAIEVLEDVVQSYPKHVLTAEARALLEKLKK